MNDERPIEKLLRRYAKKRRDDCGAPIEMHPAARRMLQGEVARQFPKRASEGEGKVTKLAQAWSIWRARLIWSLPILIGLGVGVWVLVETSELSKPEMNLAKSASVPAAPAVSVANRLPATESPVPKSAAPMPGVAEAVFDRKTSDATIVNNEPKPGARVASEVLRRRSGEAATVNASPVIAGKKLAAPNEVVSMPAEVAGETGSHRQLVAVAAPPPVVRSKVGEEPVQIRRLESPAPTTSFGAPTGYASKSAPALAAASAPEKSLAGATASYDKLGLGTAARSAPMQAYSQAFANRAPVSTYAKIAKAGSISPVLARFEVKQTGDQLRVIDSDGSTYVGQMNLPAARQSVTVAVEKKGAAQLTLKDLDQVANRQLAATPSPEQQGAQSFACRVAGTNRTLNEQVIFTWNFVPLTNGLAAAQFKSPADGGNALQDKLATQQLPSLLNNSVINGRAQLGNAKEIEINAVPVSPYKSKF